MKKEGFTLIELLLVIVIVAAISMSASIVFSQVNSNTAQEDLKNLYASIQRAGKTYIDLNDNWSRDLYESDSNKRYVTISLSALQNKGFIGDNLTNPVDHTNISLSNVVKVCITKDSNVTVTNKGVTTTINNGKYIETCILGKNNKCIANSDGEYEEGIVCCANCY